jgi:hypothetical protein
MRNLRSSVAITAMATMIVVPAAAHHHHGSRSHHARAGAGLLFLPQPAYYAPAPAMTVIAAPLYSAPWPDHCRVFRGNARIAGSGQPFYGTACWQPDGTWRVVGP